MKEKRLDGFFLSFVFYSLVLIIAAIGSSFLRVILQVVIYSPGVGDSGDNIPYLFRTVYPICMVLLHLFTAGFTYVGARFVARKVAFRHEERVPKFKKIYQIVFACAAMFAFELFYAFQEQSAFMHWYTAAVLADITGVLNISAPEFIKLVSVGDISANNFIIASVTPYLSGYMLLSLFLTCGYSGVIAYFARKKGENAGIASRGKVREQLTGSAEKKQ